MDQWLVRTANNIIAGPYTREQVVQLIQEGKLSLQDEVCQANHYWIFLHEHQEVSQQLGIQMPRAARGDDEEVTETQTEAGHQSVAAAAAAAAAAAGPPAAPAPESASMPDVPHDYEGGTAVISRGSFRDARSSAGGPAAMTAPAHAAAPASPTSPSPRSGQAAPSVRPAMGAAGASTASGNLGANPFTPVVASEETQIERPAIWRSFAWLMVVVACLIVAAVLRMLRATQG